MVEHSTDGVYEVDLDGRVQYANPALGVILGRKVGEIVGRRFVEVLDPATQFAFDAEDTEVIVRRADGIVRLLDIRAVERRVDGVLIGYDGTVRDLTAALRYEELRNDLLALIGRELRLPLSQILGLGATLHAQAEDLDTARVSTIGQTIHQHAERMARLADDLYEVSRLEYDAQLVNRHQLDVVSTVRHALSTVIGGERVEILVPAGLVVRADRRRVEQVIANLVENALRYGEPPVVVSAHDHGQEIVVAVSDRGPGVPEEQREALFSRLTLTGLPRRTTSATGIGLALVRGLVEAMGGRAWYDAGRDQGARFCFTLPSA